MVFLSTQSLVVCPVMILFHKYWPLLYFVVCVVHCHSMALSFQGLLFNLEGMKELTVMMYFLYLYEVK